MHRARALPFALLIVLFEGCASSNSAHTSVRRDPMKDRADYIDSRSAELIKRGVPKDEALGKASGEWFAQTMSADNTAEARQRTERQALDAKLEKLQRDRGRY
jgi:hypothetical protein